MTIWIDGDSCPQDIKQIVYKAAIRTNTVLKYIANSYHKIPKNKLFSLVIVDRSLDAADQHIIDHIKEDDIVITADIPLAYEAVLKKTYALSPRGQVYNENNIREKIQMRDLLQELRSAGEVSGGPRPFENKDRIKFANALDKIIQQARS